MKGNRTILKSTKSDLQTVLSLIDMGRKTMMATGNTHQWDANHPSDEQMEKDIANGFNYLVVENNEPIATFTFMPGPEPTYANIYEGQWLNDNPYYVIHRVAGKPGHSGILYDILEWCFTQTTNIRIDTHHDNKIMRHCLEKFGFTYCGIIHLANRRSSESHQACLNGRVETEEDEVNGDERVAYQKSR